MQGAQPRAIRVFVSSTFKDMHAEREELVKRVFPRLRKLCEARGVGWGEVDLRWGISEEQRAEGAVLPICLAEIHRCRPCFLCILGERYGWIPERLPQGLVEREPWLADCRGRSVTELEVVHGALRDPAMADHALFYFRDPAYLDRVPPGESRDDFASPDPESTVKLEALKERIRASGLKVRENYADPKELAELVLDDLTQVIDEHFPEDETPDPHTRETAEHEAFSRSRRRVHVGREQDLARLDAHALGTGPPLVVLGESGSGKSALLANWAARFRTAHPAALVLTHFVGASPSSSDWASMLTRLVTGLRGAFDLPGEVPLEAQELREAFLDALRQAAHRTRGRPLVLVLDALDRLEDRSGALDLTWLPSVVPARVRLVVSTLPGRPLDALGKRGWPTLTVKPLTPDDRRALIARYLGQFAKTLDAARAERIALAPQTANPLFLRALLEELRVHGSSSSLERRLGECLAAPTIDALYQTILERLERDYDDDRPGLVRDAFSFLWASRGGLAEPELLDLLGSWGLPLPGAYWSPLHLAVEEALVVKAGRIGFFHDHLRDAVEARYLSSADDRRAAHRALAAYFGRRDLGSRRIEEEPWQLMHAEAWPELSDRLGNAAYLRGALDRDPFAVRTYWAQIEVHSPLRMVDAYREVLAHPARDVDETWDVAILLGAKHPTKAAALWRGIVDHLRARPDLEGLPTALGNLGDALRAVADYDGALAVLAEQESLCRGRSDAWGLRNCLGNQALVLEARGDLEGAALRYREEERLCRRLGDRRGLAAALGGRATVALKHGRLDEAMGLLEEKERLCREEEDRKGLLVALGNQALVMRRAGDLEAALERSDEEEALCRELGEATALAMCLGNRASLLSKRGERQAAWTALEECESIAGEIGSAELRQMALSVRGGVLLDRDDLQGALAAFRAAEPVCRELQRPEALQACLGGQAMVLAKRGEHAAAIPLLEEQERICRALEDEAGLATCLANRGASLLALGARDAAAALEEGETHARTVGDDVVLHQCLGSLGILDTDRGHYRKALARLREAVGIDRRLGAESALATDLHNLALLAARDLGQPSKALPWAEEARDLARRHDMGKLLASVEALLEQLRLDPRLPPALRHAGEGEEAT